jgi:anthranilate phosphoribosyltransferase
MIEHIVLLDADCLLRIADRLDNLDAGISLANGAIDAGGIVTATLVGC